MYALYLYFLGLSFRSTAKALDPFVENRSHVAVWNWVQLFHPNKFYLKRTRVTAFIIDEKQGVILTILTGANPVYFKTEGFPSVSSVRISHGYASENNILYR